jgi:hypothetical protein
MRGAGDEGPGALLVAKMFKIHKRRGSARANDKDADVLCILQGVSPDGRSRGTRGARSRSHGRWH